MSPRAEESWASLITRALGLSLAVTLIALPLTSVPTALVAGLSAMAASAMAHPTATQPVRTWVLLAGSALVSASGLGLAGWVLDSPSLGFGASSTLFLGEVLGAIALTLPAVFALRVLVLRFPPAAILEVLLVVVAFAQLVAAHRNGAIHRPYELADPILVRGGDPSIAIFVVGAVAAAVVGLVRVHERSPVRLLWHAVAILALLLGVLLAVESVGPPPPPEANDGLALRDGEEASSGRSPASDGPDFDDEYQNQASQTPVAVVLLHDDYAPPSGVYYFRQDAFSAFNGRRMVRSAEHDHDLVTSFPTRWTDVAGAPLAGPHRASVETTVGLLADHPRPFGLEAPTTIIPATNPDSARFRRVYRVRSAALTADEFTLVGGLPDACSGTESLCFERWPEVARAHFVQAPPDPRYRALSDEIIAALPEHLRADRAARALAITRWLGEVGTYSLRSRHASATDPTGDFLFGDRTGYCVHFAHAAVFLMRSAGVPARVATGYMSPENARQGGSAILLAGGNSHAWPEVFLDGVGWVVADVAPERALDPPPGTPDEELQQLLAELLRGNQILPDSGTPETPIRELAARAAGIGRAALFAVLAGLVLLCGAAKGWRRAAPRFASDRDLPRVAMRAVLDRLAELGHLRRTGESREAFADRMRPIAPELAALTRWAEARAFGGLLPADVRARCEAARRQCDVALDARTPWWRRVLGTLDPISWVRVR